MVTGFSVLIFYVSLYAATLCLFIRACPPCLFMRAVNSVFGDLDDVLVRLLQLEIANVRNPPRVAYQTKRIEPLSAKKLVSALRNAF